MVWNLATIQGLETISNFIPFGSLLKEENFRCKLAMVVKSPMVGSFGKESIHNNTEMKNK
jgi:hypothetical protein